MIDKIGDWLWVYDTEIYIICAVVTTISVVIIAITYLISNL